MHTDAFIAVRALVTSNVRAPMLTYRAVFPKAVSAYVGGQLLGLVLLISLSIVIGEADSAETVAADSMNLLERFSRLPAITQLAVVIPVAVATITLLVIYYLAIANAVGIPVYFAYAVPVYIYLANRGYRGFFTSAMIAVLPALLIYLSAGKPASSTATFFALSTLLYGICVMVLFHWLLTKPTKGALEKDTGNSSARPSP